MEAFVGENGHWMWFGLSAFLMILDLLIGAQFFLLWLGGCAAVIGALAMLIPSLSWEIELLIFSAFSVVSLWTWWHHLKGKISTQDTSDGPVLNQRTAQLIGCEFTLSEPIVNGRGKIVVGDSLWQVEGPNLPKDALVIVTGAKGVILLVEEKKS